MSERVERLLAALIILAALVLLIVMAWPVSAPGPKQTASMTGTTSTKARAGAVKVRERDAPSYKDVGEDRSVPENTNPRVVVLERREAPPPCYNCDEPRYDNYGYEIPRRGPCGDRPCNCDDSWRPYWAWPRGGCR